MARKPVKKRVLSPKPSIVWIREPVGGYENDIGGSKEPTKDPATEAIDDNISIKSEPSNDEEHPMEVSPVAEPSKDIIESPTEPKSQNKDLPIKLPKKTPKDLSCSLCDKTFKIPYDLKKHSLTHSGIKPFPCSVCDKKFSTSSNLKTHVHSQHNEERPHQCTECEKKFATNYLLNQHKKMHNVDRANIPCPDCSKMFAFQAALKAHMVTHTKEKSAICSICGKAFVTKDVLKKHLLLHEKDDKDPALQCKVCKVRFRSEGRLKEHMTIQHPGETVGENNDLDATSRGKNSDEDDDETPPDHPTRKQLNVRRRTHTISPHECSVCQKVFQNKYKLNQHMITHSEDKPFQCSVCGEKFGQAVRKYKHMLTHKTPEGTHECHVCKERFLEVGVLCHHMRAHSDTPTFGCSECDSKFWVDSKLQDHMQTHNHICSVCDKKFFHKNGLMLHMRTHTGEKLFQCSICDMKLANEQSRKKHMLRHDTPDGEHECKICPKRFLEEGVLQLHMKTSHPEKPPQFLCSECGNNFKSACLLKKHQFTHTGEKPHVCTICGKRYTFPLQLKEHFLRAHQEERSFACSLCDKKFLTSSDRRLHERGHTLERTLKCIVCAQAFKRKAALKEHVQLHSEDPEEKPECPICHKSFVKRYFPKHLATHG